MSFSPSRSDRVPPALDAPASTSEALLRAANAVLRQRGRRPTQDIPGLDVSTLRAKYGGDPANTLQTITAVFRVPLGASWDEYRRVRAERVDLLLRYLEQRGYRLIPRKGAIRIAPGKYPATNPDPGGPPLDDQREFAVEVDCSFPRAEPVVIELDPADVAPTIRGR